MNVITAIAGSSDAVSRLGWSLLRTMVQQGSDIRAILYVESQAVQARAGYRRLF